MLILPYRKLTFTSLCDLMYMAQQQGILVNIYVFRVQSPKGEKFYTFAILSGAQESWNHCRLSFNALKVGLCHVARQIHEAAQHGTYNPFLQQCLREGVRIEYSLPQPEDALQKCMYKNLTKHEQQAITDAVSEILNQKQSHH